MHDGIVEQIGTPLDFMTNRTISSSPALSVRAMNFLKGKVKSNGSASFEGPNGVKCRCIAPANSKGGPRCTASAGAFTIADDVPKPRSWSWNRRIGPRCSPNSAASKSSPSSANSSIQPGDKIRLKRIGLVICSTRPPASD